MRAVYLKRALHDLLWWREYYEKVFPEGKDKAEKQFDKTIAMLLGNPYLGHPTDEPGVREFSIPRMPFSLIYRIDGEVLRIARVADQRSKWPRAKAKESFDEP
jgi:plasmid stabilization system protein ParE